MRFGVPAVQHLVLLPPNSFPPGKEILDSVFAARPSATESE
jgi:hypothetical protein